MRNKMFTKRLLAAGMSIAMAATLFATNSITTFAISDDGVPVELAPSESPDPSIGGDNENSWAPEEQEPTPTEEQEPTPPDYQEGTVQFGDDIKIPCTDDVVRFVEKTTVEENYYSDENDEEPDSYATEITAEEAEQQTLDFVEVEKVSTIETTVTLEYVDENGETNTVMVPNENNEMVPLELDKNFNSNKIKEVYVVEDEEGNIVREVSKRDAQNVVFGYFDTDGTFHDDIEEGDERGDYYVPSGHKYEKTNMIYSTKDANDETVYLSEEVYKALMDDPEAKFTKVQRYEVNTEKYTEKELKDVVDNIKEVNQWDYVVDDVLSDEPVRFTQLVEKKPVAPEPPKPRQGQKAGPGPKPGPGPQPGPGPKPEPQPEPGPKPDQPKQYEEVDYDVEVTYQEARIIAYEGVDLWHGTKTYTVLYYFEITDEDGNTKTYATPGTYTASWSDKYEKDDRISLGNGISDTINTRSCNGNLVYEVKEKGYKNSDSVVTVYDGDKVVWEGDRTTFENIQKAKAVTKVDDKVVVTDEKGKKVYLENEDYTVIHEIALKSDVTKDYYYTVQDKNKSYEVVFDMNGTEYTLSVDTWENSRVGITDVRVNTRDDGKIDVIVGYTYSAYDGFEPSIESKEYVYEAVEMSNFGTANASKLTLKYTPTYYAYGHKMPIWEPKNEVKVLPVDSRTMARLADAPMLFATLEDLEAFTDAEYEEEITYMPVELTWDGRFHRTYVVKGKPTYEPINLPTPNPGPNDDYYPTEPTTATIDVTPVALAAAPAAPGQVLGAVREEPAADGAAVLGASRARGTADDTTAPFVRVIIMAAVASAALFLTRKREEEN